MAHERFCKVCRGWHDLDKPWPHNCLPEAPQRSALPAPMLVRDTMEPLKSMADGKIYDSKRAMSATHKRMGFIEVGNEKQPPRKPIVDKKGIKEAANKALARFNRGERVQRHAP